MNQVFIKASVLIDSERNISSTGRSLRVTLAGIDELSGKRFYVPAFFCGEALDVLMNAAKSALEGTRKRPIVIEGVGSVVTDTFRNEAGQKVILNRVKIASAPEILSSSLKMEEDSKGQLILAKAAIAAEFTGELVNAPRKPGQYGQMVLLKEPVRGGAYVFARIPAELPLSGSKGDQVKLEGRVTRLYPRGKDQPGEIGFFVNSLAADAVAAPGQPVNAGASALEDVPF